MHLLALVFFVLVFVGIPVVVALAVAGVVGVVMTQGVPLAVVAARTASATDNVILLAIPLFVLAGSLMSAGGIAQRLFDLARVTVGHFTGGLAQVNVALSVLNGGLSASSAADVAVDAKVTIPQMKADGYPQELSGAITASSAMLSNILPPAIALLVYASLASVSVGKLFVAAAIPGLILAAAISLTVYRICRKHGYGTKRPRATARQFWTVLVGALPALAMPVIVIFGIRLGFFTATEAGAIAVAVTFILGRFVYKELALRDLPGVLARTAVDSGVVMLIVAFSAPISWILGFNQVPQQIASFFGGFTDNPLVFLLAINILLLIGGAVMEGISVLILTAPILAAAAVAMGVDPIHFGIIVVLNVVLGSITPPFGQVVFFTSSMAGIKTEAIFRQLAIFLPLLFLVLIVVTYFPQTFMWTVDLFGP